MYMSLFALVSLVTLDAAWYYYAVLILCILTQYPPRQRMPRRRMEDYDDYFVL